MPSVRVITDARAAADRMYAMADKVRAGAIVAAETAAQNAVQVMRTALPRFTPVDTGKLQDSTSSRIESDGQGNVIAVLTQDAQNKEGLYYGQFLIHGYRIVFYGHDTGRRRPPDDYPARAFESVAETILLATEFAAFLQVKRF